MSDHLEFSNRRSVSRQHAKRVVRNRLWVGVSIGAIAVMASAPLLAQETERTVTDQIIVTAAKRGEQNIQDVPMSIQAISSDSLERVNAQGMDDYRRLVPSLAVIDNGPGQAKIIIRGISTGGVTADETQNRETAAIYIDEIPVSVNGFNPDFALFDLDRIEVLRGPQGTLYGASAMSGAIRLITNKPDSSEFHAKGEASVSATRHGGVNESVQATINVPVVEDTLAVRATGYQIHNSGYIDNIAIGRDDWNDVDIKGGRISALWTPASNVSIQPTFIFQDLDQGGTNAEAPELGEYKTDFLLPTVGYKDKAYIYNLTGEVDLGGVNFVSSTSYTKRDFDSLTSLEYVDLNVFGSREPHPYCLCNSVTDFSQEIRFSSSGNETLNWVLGAFYDKQKRKVLFDSTYPPFDALSGIPASALGAPEDNGAFWGRIDTHLEQISVFGEATLSLTDKLDVTAGLRWFDWDSNFDLFYSGFFNGGPTGHVDKTNNNGFNPKFNISYKASDDLLLYAQAAKGFRLGGVNDYVPPGLCGVDAPASFDSDSLWNYEAGVKADAFDQRVRVNGSVYYIDWKDIQTVTRLDCGYGYTENLGSATSKGVELEASFVLAEGFTLNAGGSFTDAESNDDRLPYIPRFNGNVSIQYEREFGDDWTMTFFGDVQHVGNSYTQIESSALALELPAYTVGNLSMSIGHDRWEATLFVKNLWDERIVNNRDFPSLFDNYSSITLGRPQTIGVSMRLAM